ncbi:MAG: N-acetylglucosamine-6-phosphate deacetylase [Actinomycetota bacterium]|nr:N-acetylglucosamine-6-phosphate deacetylase [Actinomycetota bacterium]
MADLLITSARVCAPEGVWEPGWLLARDGRIEALGPGDPPGGMASAAERLDGAGARLLPGFIDVHVHGGAGADTMDADADALRHLARFHASHGVTALLPTTWSASEADLAAALKAVTAVAGAVEGGATILGAHLEGPWINAGRCGGQDPDAIRPPDAAEATRLLESGPVRLVALAPELDGAAAVIETCRQRDVVVSAGHTDASYEEMAEAVRRGVTQVTHTFNAMSGFGHRDPGTAGAALAFPELRCELIADGVHVHPGAMAVLARAKGPEGVVLVSDATRAAGLPEGPVDLGGRAGHHAGGAVRLADGRLAGSVLTLDVALRHFAAVSAWPWEDLWRATSANAAATLGLVDKGHLSAGADADLVLIDEDWTVRLTVVEGRIVHRG